MLEQIVNICHCKSKQFFVQDCYLLHLVFLFRSLTVLRIWQHFILCFGKHFVQFNVILFKNWLYYCQLGKTVKNRFK